MIMESDGWTVRTRDRKCAAHFEHTIGRWRLILIQPVQIRLTMMIMMRMIIDLFILNTV